MQKPFMALLLAAALLIPCAALAGETRIPPSQPVPDYVTWLLDTAVGEIGYREGDHGYTKYGEWAGDPYCQWCAEFLCWCVDQVDRQHGTALPTLDNLVILSDVFRVPMDAILVCRGKRKARQTINEER